MVGILISRKAQKAHEIAKGKNRFGKDFGDEGKISDKAILLSNLLRIYHENSIGQSGGSVVACSQGRDENTSSIPTVNAMYDSFYPVDIVSIEPELECHSDPAVYVEANQDPNNLETPVLGTASLFVPCTVGDVLPKTPGEINQTLGKILNLIDNTSCSLTEDDDEEQILRNLFSPKVRVKEEFHPNEIQMLLAENENIRKYLMLFKDECPKELQKQIFTYELNRCRDRLLDSNPKKVLFSKLIDGTISKSEFQILNTGRTGRTLTHFGFSDFEKLSLVQDFYVKDTSIDLEIKTEPSESILLKKLPRTSDSEQINSYYGRIAGIAALDFYSIARRLSSFITWGFAKTAFTETAKKASNEFLKQYLKKSEVSPQSVSSEITPSENASERRKSYDIIKGLKKGNHHELSLPYMKKLEKTEEYKQHQANYLVEKEQRAHAAEAVARARASRF